jgi:hypothetical protein
VVQVNRVVMEWETKVCGEMAEVIEDDLPPSCPRSVAGGSVTVLIDSYLLDLPTRQAQLISNPLLVRYKGTV